MSDAWAVFLQARAACIDWLALEKSDVEIAKILSMEPAASDVDTYQR